MARALNPFESVGDVAALLDQTIRRLQPAPFIGKTEVIEALTAAHKAAKTLRVRPAGKKRSKKEAA